MSEYHFRSHFWPFQIDRPFWMSGNHFRSHFWPFQIDTELFFKFWTKCPLAAILDGTTMSIIGSGCVADENIIFPRGGGGEHIVALPYMLAYVGI